MKTDTKIYEAGIIANYFLYKAKGRLTPLQIQKLVYFAHGWSLAIYDEPLISEPIEAWEYGPVIPSLYHLHKHHGGEIIGGFNPKQAKRILEIQSLTALLDRIWEVYGELTGIELSILTHQENTPWKDARQNGFPTITDESIAAYFKETLTEIA